MWLLAKKGRNRVFLRFKFAPYLNNISNQGCDNAVKAFVEFYSWGPSTILVLKKIFKMFKGQKFIL